MAGRWLVGLGVRAAGRIRRRERRRALRCSAAPRNGTRRLPPCRMPPVAAAALRTVRSPLPVGGCGRKARSRRRGARTHQRRGRRRCDCRGRRWRAGRMCHRNGAHRRTTCPARGLCGRGRGGRSGQPSVYEARRDTRTRMGRKEPQRQFVRPRACAERLVLVWPLEWLNRRPIGTAAIAAKDAGAALVPRGLQDHPRRQRATRIHSVRRDLCHVVVPALVLLKCLAEGHAYGHAAESLAYAENAGRPGALDPVSDGAHCADIERGASHLVSANLNSSAQGGCPSPGS